MGIWERINKKRKDRKVKFRKYVAYVTPRV